MEDTRTTNIFEIEYSGAYSASRLPQTHGAIRRRREDELVCDAPVEVGDCAEMALEDRHHLGHGHDRAYLDHAVAHPKSEQVFCVVRKLHDRDGVCLLAKDVVHARKCETFG